MYGDSVLLLPRQLHVQFDEFIADSRRSEHTEVREEQCDVVGRGVVNAWVRLRLRVHRIVLSVKPEKHVKCTSQTLPHIHLPCQGKWTYGIHSTYSVTVRYVLLMVCYECVCVCVCVWCPALYSLNYHRCCLNRCSLWRYIIRRYITISGIVLVRLLVDYGSLQT